MPLSHFFGLIATRNHEGNTDFLQIRSIFFEEKPGAAPGRVNKFTFGSAFFVEGGRLLLTGKQTR